MFGNVDKPLLYTIIALFVGGFFILGSASMVQSLKISGFMGYYTLRQMAFGGTLGIVAFLVALHVPYRFWKKLSIPFILVSFILLALVLIPETSLYHGGARRWLALGPISFQPSEFLKLAFIIYLAAWLDTRRKDISSIPYGLIPFSLLLSVVGIFLIMQPDIGTLFVIAATSGILYFLGGGKFSQITALGLFGAAIMFFLIRMAPYRLSRITAFLNPDYDPLGAGYQIKQAFIAIGSGGIFGLGYGKGIQKYNFLPEPMGDSIFAVFAEEFGFAGAVLFIAIFGILFWRGLVIARRAPDTFGVLLAAGISIGIMTQAFINMASISGLLPLTGLTLPFISYGSSSLVATLFSMGILLNISKHV